MSFHFCEPTIVESGVHRDQAGEIDFPNEEDVCVIMPFALTS